VYYQKGPRSRAFKDRYLYASVIRETVNNLSRKDKMWLNLACKLADTSTERTKHGCIIVKSGAVQCMGVNTYRNQPGIVEQIDALSTHAEINALKNGRKSDLSGSVAFVARVNNHGEQRQSRPCPDCLKALKDAGIKRIVYTINGEEYL